MPSFRGCNRSGPDVVLGNFYEDELEKIEAAGLRVPHDLGIVGLSVKSMDSSISGIFQDDQLLGASAADKLIDLVERNEIPRSRFQPFTLTSCIPGGTRAARLEPRPESFRQRYS